MQRGSWLQFGSTLLIAVVAGGGYIGCRVEPFASDGPGPSMNAEVMKLATASTEAGSVSFRHGFHTRLLGADGERIACTRCHHPDSPEAAALPWRCLDCHPGEKTDPRYPELPT